MIFNKKAIYLTVLTFISLVMVGNLRIGAAWSATDNGTAGQLGVSSNGHYFTYQGNVMMMIGDSGTQCVPQNLNLDHRAWIDDLGDRGIKGVHVWAIQAINQTQDGSSVHNRWGYVIPAATPWARKTSGPKAQDQRYCYDLTRFDEGTDPKGHYWPRLRDMAAYARHKGMVMGVTLFFGWPKHATEERPHWQFHPFNKQNGGHLDCKYYIMRIESPGTEVLSEPWSDSWPRDKKTQWVWERYVDKMIRELAPYENIFFVYKDERSYEFHKEGGGQTDCGPGKWDDNMEDHFYNFIRKRTDAPIIDWGKRRDAADVVMNGNRSADKNELAGTEFGYSPKRPVMTLESPPYELGNSDIRRGIWTYSIGGGHFFFHDDERQGTARTGVMGYDPKVEGAIKPLQTYDWLGHASRFFNEQVKNLDSMLPCNSLVGKGAYCLADNGREYAVYSKDSHSTITVDLGSTSGQKLDCRFYNPRTGVFKSTFQRNGGSDLELFTKPSSEDWVLHILAPSAPVAGNFTTNGLVALLNFEEIGGTICTDSTGNGHDACLVGTSRRYVSIPASNPSAKISINSDTRMQSESFTWDIWFEAGTPTNHGRLAAQTSAIGGVGAELLIPWTGNAIGVRINNKGAAFDEPAIGTRSSPAPPDHWGQAVEEIHRNSGSEHIILTHDASTKTVRIFVGLKGQTLKLSFEATYTGTYEVGSVPLVIGNNPSGGRVFAGNYFQFAYYDRALNYRADDDRNVTGGEVYNNHFAGDNVNLP